MFINIVCVHHVLWSCMCATAHVCLEVRGWLHGGDSLLPLWGAWWSNTGIQAWVESVLFAEPSCKSKNNAQEAIEQTPETPTLMSFWVLLSQREGPGVSRFFFFLIASSWWFTYGLWNFVLPGDCLWWFSAFGGGRDGLVDSFARYRSLRILMWCVVRAPSQCAAHFSRKHVVTHRSAVQPRLVQTAEEESMVQQRRKCVLRRTGGRMLQVPYVLALRHCLDRSLDSLPCWFCPGSFLLGPQDYSEHLGWNEASSMWIFLLTTGEGVWGKKKCGWITTLLLQWECAAHGKTFLWETSTSTSK